MRKRKSERKSTSEKSSPHVKNTSNSETLNSEIINLMKEAIHVVDSDLNLVMFNNTVHRWGDDFDIPEPRQGMSLHELCPFLSETVFDEYRNVFRTGEAHVTPESCIIIDGWEYFRETSKIPIKENGITVYVITVIRNIADSVRARNVETSLYRIARAAFVSSDSTELYRELYKIISVIFPAAIFSIVLCDRSTGAVSDPLTSQLHDNKTPADHVAEELERYVIRTGKAVLIENNSSLEKLRRSGEIKLKGSLTSGWIGAPLRIGAETVGALSLKANKLGMQFTEKHKEILRFVSDQVAMSIERRKIIISLRESEEKYRNLVESASDGIAIIQDSVIVFANHRLIKVLGYETVGITGSELGELFYSDEDAMKFEADKSLTEFEQAPFCKIRLRKLDGSVIYVELNRNDTTYRGNRAELIFIRDITERQKTEEEKNRLQARIQHAQKLESLGVLAGGIAHDFNNLLMGILGNASLSLDQLPPESAIRKNIGRIETSALRAADLTNQLLAYSGKGIFVIEPVHLSKLIGEMLNLLETSISKNTVLDFNPCKNLPPVEGDATQIRQIVMNIILNASEALGDAGGVIDISTRMVVIDSEYLEENRFNEDIAEGAYVCLTISDAGCGIPDDNFSLIFDPFFTTKSYGRGLGLAAVLGIIRAHEGAINVHSKCGEGTRFEVFLPCAGVQIKDSRLKVETCDEQPEKGLILFVDDDEEVRNVCIQILENSGYDVITASDGLEAVAMFRENSDKILLVFMDMLMPNMDGIEAFRKIREIRPDIRIIMCSGYTEQVVMNSFKDNCPSGFLHKPYRTKDMLRKLADVMSDDL